MPRPRRPPNAGEPAADALAQTAASIEVTSPVFSRIRRIPKKHSCGPGTKTLGRTYDQNFAFDAELPKYFAPAGLDDDYRGGGRSASL